MVAEYPQKTHNNKNKPLTAELFALRVQDDKRVH